MDQQSCDHPSQSQVYRHAISGRGDPVAANQLFPYALAPKDAKVEGLIWGTTWIDPMTGHTAEPDAPGAIHVWTWRDRPLFTHSRDKTAIPGVKKVGYATDTARSGPATISSASRARAAALRLENPLRRIARRDEPAASLLSPAAQFFL
jgi:hypothetical protein